MAFVIRIAAEDVRHAQPPRQAAPSHRCQLGELGDHSALDGVTRAGDLVLAPTVRAELVVRLGTPADEQQSVERDGVRCALCELEEEWSAAATTGEDLLP